MRYDEENNRIVITNREFVTTARRAIATSVPQDADEPTAEDASKRVLAKLLGEPLGYEFSHGFNCAGYDFCLLLKAEKADGCKLWFATNVTSNPARPKKADAGELRGEGYVAAYAYAIQKELTRVELNFIFINPETGEHATSREYVALEKLKKFFDKCSVTVSVYAKPEIERVTVRLPSMKALRFPYKNIREGQSAFVRSAYRCIARGGTLYATAPTGTGKTVSAIFPAIRAMGEGKREKTFYFTPKETTANAAVECISLLCEKGAIIRAVRLTAKEKCCKNGLLCRENRDRCEYSKCNKLSEAALALYNEKLSVATEKEIGELARAYKICPYELSLTYAELCDFIILDFNYLFDPSVYIRRFFTAGGNYAFLIDEAHNLPDRAREMYSADISDDFLRTFAEDALLG